MLASSKNGTATITIKKIKKKYFSGVGSRRTPLDVCAFMTALAAYLETKDWVLRSGGALGADQAFEAGIRCVSNKQIFRTTDVTPEAMEIAARIHPAWHRCNDHAKLLHSRNIFQVLGSDLKNPVPSDFLVCWTDNGLEIGGTRTAIVLAHENHVPVFNLGSPVGYDNLEVWLESHDYIDFPKKSFV